MSIKQAMTNDAMALAIAKLAADMPQAPKATSQAPKPKAPVNTQALAPAAQPQQHTPNIQSGTPSLAMPHVPAPQGMGQGQANILKDNRQNPLRYKQNNSGAWQDTSPMLVAGKRG